MDFTQQIKSIGHYTDEHYPLWLDVVRIFLGIAIFIRGIYFIQNPEALLQIIQDSTIGGWAFIVEHHVAFTYLVGGILIGMGLLTRIAILFELPVFFGSIYCNLAESGFFSVFSDLVFSIVVFALLIFFLIWGSGRVSVDAYMKSHKSDEE